MINTIFYFVPTFEEYQAKQGSGEISPRTIVFVADIRAIYKNGVRYGGYNSGELDDIIDGKLGPVIASINSALAAIQALNDDIDSVISDKQAEIQNIINETFNEYTWLKKNLGDVFAYQGFQDQLNAFLTAIGNLTTSSAQWTTLMQTINSITARVVDIENGDLPRLLEAVIKAWINDGVAGIDLSTYALRADLDDYLRTDQLNSALDGTNAFIQLRSDLDSAKAAIGAWSQSHGTNDTITQLLGLLQIQVDNIENSVTTSLSSTIRQYLGTDLNTAVDTYLQNQAGLILNSNLDGAVSQLFSQTSLTKGAVESWANTAGFIATSDLGSATATQYATNGHNLYAALTTSILDDNSFLTAIANNITIKGSQIDIDASHQINLNAQKVTASNLNVVNNNKTVAYINDEGYASFINGHIYIPYTATNWQNFQNEHVVGLYVDSVATGTSPADVTYANSKWSTLFHPRTLIEPDGLRFENADRALSGIVKSGVLYDNHANPSVPATAVETYSVEIAAYDPRNNNNYCGILLQPSDIRNGNESSGGSCKIRNYKDGFDPTDYNTWSGRLDIDYWNSIVMKASDEIIINAENGGLYGISLRGSTHFIGDIYQDSGTNHISSDERLKTIVSDVNANIEDIANTRIVNFTYNSDESNSIHTGTIAQDWKNIVPNAVTENPEGNLALDYNAINTVSAITAAREIVKLKQENEELKQRLAAIEARLGIA